MTATSLVDIARAGLLEITLEANIGAFLSEETNEDGVSTILFASAMLGYPDWHWTVSVAQLPEEEPTVLEAELLPGVGSLIAPDWVPWADRLEDYKAAQAAIAAGELVEGDEDSDSDDDDSDDDDSDDDDSDDEDDHDEHDDDDLGDDPDDGIDFESDESLAELEAEALEGEDDDDSDGDSDEDSDEDDELAVVPPPVGEDEQDQSEA